jgi:hypothetical protein
MCLQVDRAIDESGACAERLTEQFLSLEHVLTD